MYCWQNVGKIANIAPTLPTDGQRWPNNECLLGMIVGVGVGNRPHF